MKTLKLGLVLTLLVGLLRLSQLAHAQGGGCPATLPPVADQPDVILQTVLLAPANPEQPSSSAPYAFYEGRLAIDWQPGAQLVISSSRDVLSGVCVDDLLELRSLTTGRVVRVDFRSADRQRIVHLEPLALPADFFIPGSNLIEVWLVDVSPGFRSNSQLYGFLLPVGDSPATLTELTAAAATPALVYTQAPLPTLTVPTTPSLAGVQAGTPGPIPSPTLRPTHAVGSAPRAVTPAGPASQSVSAPAWLRGRWAPLAGAALLLPLLAFLAVRVRNRLRLKGSVSIYDSDKFMKEVELAPYGAMVTFGCEADILLPGQAIPPIAARLRAQRAEGGDVEMLFEALDPETGEVVDSHPWRDGDEEVIGSYRLKFTNYSQEDEIPFDEGAYDAYSDPYTQSK